MTSRLNESGLSDRRIPLGNLSEIPPDFHQKNNPKDLSIKCEQSRECFFSSVEEI